MKSTLPHNLIALMAGFFLWLSLTLGLAQALTPNPASEAAIVRQPMTLKLDDGVNTPAELDYPRSAAGPLPAVLMLGGSGSTDMDGATLATPAIKPYKEMLDNLVKHDFVTFKYDKRGLGQNGFVSNQRQADSRTNERLVADAVVALRRLQTDPRVDPNRVYILAHSQGTLIAPQLVQKVPGAIKGLVLAGTIVDWNAAFDYQLVDFYLEQAAEIDTDQDGLLTAAELTASLNSDPNVYANDRRNLLFQPGYFQVVTPPGQASYVTCESSIDLNHDCKFSIADELKPALQKVRERLLSSPAILRASGESDLALKSLLDGPRLNEILPTLQLPAFFQHGADDARAPLNSVLALEKQLFNKGIPTGITVYQELTHTFTPDKVVLALSFKQPVPDSIIPPAVLDDQVAWLQKLAGPVLPAGNPNPTTPAAVAPPAEAVLPASLPQAGYGGLTRSDPLPVEIPVVGLVLLGLGIIIACKFVKIKPAS